MKYWRGYLTAAILAACTWGLQEFAAAHSALIDMIYPYVTRMAQNFLAEWSGSLQFCLWEVLLLAAAAVAMVSVVLMVILKWNPIQWFGWICAAVATVVFLNTAIYGLNEFAGPLSDDIQLKETDYTVAELEAATVYYQKQANELALQVQRDSSGNVQFADFDTLAVQAAEGFDTLVYEQSLSVFAGSAQPVKKLGIAEWFTARGITGVTVGLTGEAAVNPEAPAVLLPYAMCEEMSHRRSIVVEQDASFGAYLACEANSDVQFQYSGALMAYRFCYGALEALDNTMGSDRATKVAQGENSSLKKDLAVCDEFFGAAGKKDNQVCDLLTSWHIQKVVLPSMVVEEELFDPLDETQVDLSGIVNAKENTDE